MIYSAEEEKIRAAAMAWYIQRNNIDGAPPPKPKHDPVNHPLHYNEHPSGVECITIAEHYNFNVGNAIKYLWRHGLKSAEIQDLEKARWYVEREIARLSTGTTDSEVVEK